MVGSTTFKNISRRFVLKTTDLAHRMVEQNKSEYPIRNDYEKESVSNVEYVHSYGPFFATYNMDIECNQELYKSSEKERSGKRGKREKRHEKQRQCGLD